MEREAGRDGGREFRQSQVLHDDGIDTAGFQPLQLLCGIVDLRRKDQGVHGHESLHAVAVEKFHQLRQVLVGEIGGAQAGIEARQAEVDGIRATGDGGAGAVPIAGGREEFGSGGGFRHVIAVGAVMLARGAPGCHAVFLNDRSGFRRIVPRPESCHDFSIEHKAARDRIHVMFALNRKRDLADAVFEKIPGRGDHSGDSSQQLRESTSCR